MTVLNEIKDKKELKRQKVICYSRTCGYYSPMTTMNDGKLSEVKDRKTYDKQLSQFE